MSQNYYNPGQSLPPQTGPAGMGGHGGQTGMSYGPAGGSSGGFAGGPPAPQGLSPMDLKVFYQSFLRKLPKELKVKLTPKDVWRESFGIITHNLPALLAIHLPYIIASFACLLVALINSNLEFFYINILNALIFIDLILFLSYQPAVGYYVNGLMKKKDEITVKMAIKRGLDCSLSAFISSFIFFFVSSVLFGAAFQLIILGFSFLGIWAFIVVLGFIFLGALWVTSICTSLAACGIERLSTLKSFEMSQRLARGNYFKISCALAPLVIPIGAFSLLYRHFFSLISFSAPAVFVFALGFCLVDLIIAVVLAVTFGHLKIVRDSNDFSRQSFIFEAFNPRQS